MPKQPLWLPFRFDRLESFDTFMHLFFKVLLVFLLSCVYQEKCEYFWKGNVVSEMFFLIFEKKNIPFYSSTYWKTKLFPCYPLSIFLSKGDSIGKGFELTIIMINSSLQSTIPQKNRYKAKKKFQIALNRCNCYLILFVLELSLLPTKQPLLDGRGEGKPGAGGLQEVLQHPVHTPVHTVHRARHHFSLLITSSLWGAGADWKQGCSGEED